MNGFSVASLSSTCSSISHRALSTAVEIDELRKASPSSNDGPALEALGFLGTRLQQFRQHTDVLLECLTSATLISPTLQDVVTRTLRQCDAALAVVEKQVKRLHPQSLERVDPDAFDAFQELLVAHSRVFILATQLLSVPSAASQDSKLDHDDAQDLIVTAEASSQRIFNGVDILAVPSDNSSTNGASYPDGTSPSLITDAVPPPPFDSLSPDTSSPKTAKSPLAKGFSSLTNSLKAMAAGMRPRPEPFVTALCQAATHGHIQQIKGLIDQGANINGRNEDGNTALICAILSNQPKTAIYLLELGADKSVRSNSGKRRPPLYHALDVNDLSIAQYLLDHGAIVNEKNIVGQSYFIDVVQSEKLDLIKLLLRYGADVNAREITGRPIIVYAVNKGNMELVRLLLGHGADANARDISGHAILAAASNKCHPELVQLLLASGADPNTRTITGTPVLVDAVQRGRADIAKFFLTAGANANEKDLMGTSILLSTVRSDKLSDSDKDSLVRLLLAHGASANVTDSWGLTGLAHATAGDNLDLIRVFLAHGADPNQLIHGDTLLVNAIDKRNWDQARLLIEHGANPNKADKLGRTPLLVAMQKQNVDIVNLLIERGADVNQTGAVTPVGFARVWGDDEILRTLRAHGALGVGDELNPSPAMSRRSTRVERQVERPESPPPGYRD
ncbi:ankyrin repeat-containing domain protein [Coniochaeta sp. 2T2.1]|nr:ankyrin repeat-containing domain protein [Coniochaeta sp. 2T2.1]